MAIFCDVVLPVPLDRHFTYKLKDAIREGYLVPYQIYRARTVKTASEMLAPALKRSSASFLR